MKSRMGIYCISIFLSILLTNVLANAECNNGLYNLCDLRQPSRNGYSFSLGDYDYAVNVAAPLARSEEECSDISNTTVAIQKLRGRHQCYSLADVNYQSFIFLSSEDANKGVKVVYRGGAEGRSVSLTLPCDPHATTPPAIKRISEPFRLNYDFEFYPLKAACPITTTATLPYTNDLTVAPNTNKVFRVSVDGTMVSLKIDFGFGDESDLDTRDVKSLETRSDYASNIYLYTRRGAIPTFNSYEFSTFINKFAPNPDHRSLIIRGNPYLDAQDIYISLYGASRLPGPTMVHLEISPQNCLNCNARGTLDCANQICHCEYPFVYKDCSGELKNITSGTSLMNEKVASSFWTVYRLERQPEEIYLNVIVESTTNEAPIILVSQGNLPTIDNFLVADGYERTRMSNNKSPYRFSDVKERHLSVELKEDSDSIIYVGVYGGTTLSADSAGFVERTSNKDFHYSISVQAYACHNNCTSSKAGRCNTETHKCHCHSGYAGKSCSINTKLLSAESERVFQVKPGAVEYFEYATHSNSFYNISITSKDDDKPLEDVMIYVGDGYVPDINRYYLSSRSLKVDEEFIGEIDLEEGEQEEEGETSTGGSDTLEDMSYFVELPPRKSKVKYFIGILNRDPYPHNLVISVNIIDYKGGLGPFGAFVLMLFMLIFGVAGGISLTMYREVVQIYLVLAATKLRVKLPFLSSSSSSNKLPYSNLPQQDDDDNPFLTTDDIDDTTTD